MGKDEGFPKRAGMDLLGVGGMVRREMEMEIVPTLRRENGGGVVIGNVLESKRTVLIIATLLSEPFLSVASSSDY